MMRDLVSVIMPSYNTGRFIEASICSVLAQTYDNWELIIVDDCSTDNTDQVVAPFLKDERIHYLKNEKNSGAAVSRNKAILAAKGEYIAFLDSDDLWAPNKLRRQLTFMKKNGYSFTCTYNDYIDEDSESLHRMDTCPGTITWFGMYLYNWIGCLTVIYRVKDVGLIQIEDIKKRNDYALWLKVIQKSDCHCLKENLASYRVRKKSVSHDNFFKLIKAQYVLYRVADHRNPVTSFFIAVVNLCFGLIRKLVYVKRMTSET